MEVNSSVSLKGFYARCLSVILRRVNVLRNARRNPVCDENALDINMDQSGSTVEKKASPTPME